ncbi:MAG: hypothetical protein J6S53_02720 [Lentisphaeria bacterium]|nr:hypothetical protein [Lentisphaeria bacterium]
MKKILTVFCLLILTVLFTGCARQTVIPEEVMQLPQYAQIYTAFNLWSNPSPDKEEGSIIDELNTRKGELIPFGTQIEFLKSDAENIIFKTVKDQKKHTLKYSAGKSVRNIEEVIKTFFTTKTMTELTAGIRKPDIEKLKRGLVEKGMRRNEVLLGYGLPPPLRTPVLNVDTWTYYTDYGVTQKVVFFRDKVVEILAIN